MSAFARGTRTTAASSTATAAIQSLRPLPRRRLPPPPPASHTPLRSIHTARTKPTCLYAPPKPAPIYVLSSSPASSSRARCTSLRHSSSSSTSSNSNSSNKPKQKTLEQVSARNRSGPFSARAALVFVIAGAGLAVYFRYERARVERKRVAEATKGVGKPKIGGAFTLTDQDGGVFTERDMKGGFSIVYFGFTHCPDICPEELDKLARIIDLVAASPTAKISATSFPAPTNPATPLPPPPTPTVAAAIASSSPQDSSAPAQEQARRRRTAPLLPLFITCDPARDTPAALSSYLAEFHPGILGLTGTWQAVKEVCKLYRVYFSTPEGAGPGMDYLVDHSIYFYLMDPDGDFVEAIGRQHSADRAAQIILEHMSDWRDGKKVR